MRRYLMFISYVGTPYHGLAKQLNVGSKTVIGTLEAALKHLQTENKVHVVGSSRTDKGVHALCNAVHVDLQHRKDGFEYDPWLVTFVTNQLLNYSYERIRVLKTLRVSNDFHSRHHATGRSYIYRIQVPKKQQSSFSLPYSSLEVDRVCTVDCPVDMGLMREAADRLSGEHDFSAFTTLKALREKQMQTMVKPMQVTIEPGNISFQKHMDIYNEYYDVWDIKYTSKSYLYHQVRHMTGIMISVGKGEIPPDVVTDMLQNPMKYHQEGPLNIPHNARNCPPDGLYLAKVHYNDEDLKLQNEDHEDARLFNPLEKLKDIEYGYSYIQKARNFMNIHERLLDPDSDLPETLVRLFKKGKPSRKTMKKFRKIKLTKEED